MIKEKKEKKKGKHTHITFNFTETVKTADFLKTTLIVILFGLMIYLINSGIYTFGSQEVLRSPRVMGLIELPVLFAALGLFTVILYTHQRDIEKNKN